MGWKSAAIAGTVIASLCLPVALPYAAGAVVAVSAGPIVIEVSRARGIDVDVDMACLEATCPLATVRIATVEAPSYLAGI